MEMKVDMLPEFVTFCDQEKTTAEAVLAPPGAGSRLPQTPASHHRYSVLFQGKPRATLRARWQHVGLHIDRAKRQTSRRTRANDENG
jgi:hypothetical protein